MTLHPLIRAIVHDLIASYHHSARHLIPAKGRKLPLILIANCKNARSSANAAGAPLRYCASIMNPSNWCDGDQSEVFAKEGFEAQRVQQGNMNVVQLRQNARMILVDPGR
jgi:hypothetical protein